MKTGSSSRTSTESTSGGERAHAGLARDTSATGQEGREAIPPQPPSGANPEEAARFLDQAALLAIDFQTPDLERYNTIDRAAEAVEGLTRELHKHSPTFRSAVQEATGVGMAQPSRIQMVQGEVPVGGMSSYNYESSTVYSDPRDSSVQNNLNRHNGFAIFEMFNAASRKRFIAIRQDAETGSYEQRAQKIRQDAETDSDEQRGQASITIDDFLYAIRRHQSFNPEVDLLPAFLYAKDIEHEEWLNGKKLHQAFNEAEADGMHVPPEVDLFIELLGTSEQPGPWASFEVYLYHGIKNGHTRRYIDDYVNHIRPSLNAQSE